MQQMDDPPYLSVGTEVSAKYKGAFCEAKVRKVVRNIKCKVAYKQGLGTGTVSDDQIKGDILRVGAVVEVKHPDRRDFVEATITKIQDCSQYTVVFDDGDITTLRRSALCLKSGRHFNESETLDQLPLTHPEHFGNPVIGGRRGRSCRSRQLQDDSSEDEDDQESKTIQIEKEEHIGKVVCVESTDTKKKGPKENWFPALVVSPTTQDTVRIRVKEEYLVRSFKDGRYYTVPKKEATEFTREMSHKQDGQAILAALEYLDNDVLPPHWDRDALFGLGTSSSDFDQEFDSDSSDDEPREEKDHFVAQLYKYMDDRGTPLNKGPSIVNRDVDLYRLFRAVDKLGGYNRVTGQNQWKSIAIRLGFTPATTSITNLVKQAYKKFLQPFEEFNRKLGCTMVAYPRANRIKGRSLVRANSVASPKPAEHKETEKIVKQQTSTLAIPIQADEVENNSETETKHSAKRKLSTGSTVNIGKVKALVDKFDAKSSETTSFKEKEPSPVVEIIVPTTPTTSRTPVSKISQKIIEEPRTAIPASVVSTPPSITVKKEKEPKEKVVEAKEIPVKEKMVPIEKSTSSSSTSKMDKNSDKRGRKKKDEPPEKYEKTEKPQEKVIEKKEMPVEREIHKETITAATTDFPIEVGDKLKVYYHEQKVTYEAKVIEISDQGTPLYLVHYTGWNTRYDEWVPKERIAENLSNNKIKRTKSNASRSSSSNNSNVGSTTPTSNPNKSSAKRGRGGSRSDSQPPRSTTPSSVASNSSRTKSPATPAQRRTTRGQPGSMRRTSNNTDISSVQTDSDTDSDEPVKKPQSRNSANNSGNKLNSTMTPVSSSPSTTTPSIHISANSRSSSSQDEESFSTGKGVDYDLNQIRSELKGIRKIKSPSPDVERLLISKIETEIKQEIPCDKLLSSREHLLNQATIPTKATSSCSDTKNTSSDVSSDSESLGGDDDSISSLDKTIATVKNESKFSKSDSKHPLIQPSSLTGKNLSVFSSIIEKPIPKENKSSIFESERDSKSVADLIEKIEETVTIKPSIFSSKLSDSILNQKPNIDKVQTNIKTEKLTTPLSSLKTEKKIIMSEKMNRDKLNKVSADKLSSNIGTSHSSISETIKLQQQTVCDIYEFKEPEPFEYETTTTPSKKQPIVVDSSSTLTLSAEKRCGKVLGVKTEKIIELKTNLNTTPTPVVVPIPSLAGGKRKKNSPNKELDFKSFKQIKKEESIGSPTEEYGSTPLKMNTSASSSSSIESTFDVLRKSPSFNMRGGINPGDCNILPQLSPAIESLNSQIKSNFFSNSIDFESTKPKSEKKLFEDMLCDVPSTSMSTPIKIEEASIIKEAISADSDVDSPIHGKDFDRVKELLTVETFEDLEPPKIEKIPSIADRVLKALNQQSGSSKLESTISSERIFSLTPLSSASTISSLTPVSLPLKSHQSLIGSDIVKPSIIDSIQTSKSIEIPLISIDTYPKKSITSSAISMFSANVSTSNSTDILESISPKNNDLSETIQKLESAIKKTIPTSVQPVNIDRFNDDSSESTDSEQRLIIEDESLSSETQGILTANSSTGCSVSNLPIQSQQPQQDTIETENNFSSIKFNHQDGAISIFSSTQSTIIHSQLDKQQMTAVEFLTTGMIDRENERLSLLHSAANNHDSILSQAQHINTTQLNIIKKDESQPNAHNNNTFLQEQTQQNESLSMLLCEETIPGSPAPVCTNTNISTIEQPKKAYDNQSYITQNPHPTSSDIKPVPMEIENDLISATKTVEIKIETNVAISEIKMNPSSSCITDTNNPDVISCKPNVSAQNSVSVNSGHGVSSVTTNSGTGSPRDSISPEDSKSEGESDIKKRDQGSEINRISPKKRRRQRKSSEMENTAHNNNNNNNNSHTSNIDNDNENINTNNTINSSHNTSNINNSSSNINIITSNNSSSKRRKIPHARKHTNGSDSEDNNFDVSALQHRNPRRSPKPCQYNFLVEFDVTLSSAQRITIVKKKIQEVRKTYNMVKAELASIDRRRKKLRRREREKNKLAKATAS